MEPSIIEGLMFTAITGLFVWVFKMNADVQVLKEKARVAENTLNENTESNKKLAEAITELRLSLEGMKK